MNDRGFHIFEGVFTGTEMTRAVDELAGGSLERTRAGARHVLSQPTVRAIATDPRMLRVARQFVGEGAVPFRATLFDKSPTANWLVVWHQDTALPLRARVESADWGPWSRKAGLLYAHAPAWALEQVIALRVSLDDSLAGNGPLRVLPHTHRGGVYTDAEVERLARDVEPVDCVVAAGGIVAMRPLTVHASSKSTDERPRRVLHIEYASSLCLGPGIDLAIA